MNLLLVPGFMADQALWDDLLPFLPGALDIHFANLNTGATIDDMARAILEQAPPNFIVLGFSMGGYVARAIAHQAGARVQGIILVATSARPDQPQMVERRLRAARQMAAGAFHGLARGAIRASLHAGRAGDSAMIERVRGMGERLGADVFLRQSAVVRAGDLDTLHTIACPALVVGADGDQLRTIDEARELADGMPDARLAVIKQSGHMVPLEAPQVLGGVITAWLRRFDARAGAPR
jgi:pimeloyl-ACP methyl ester carboxylesterase